MGGGWVRLDGGRVGRIGWGEGGLDWMGGGWVRLDGGRVG